MRRLRLLVSHPVTGQGLRYGIAGVAVALVYLGLPVLLNGPVGLPIQATIPIAFVIAMTLHFNLQRHFVFRHVPAFALSRVQQIQRYVMIAAVQYPATAIATALLPSLLGLSGRATFVLVALTMSLAIFLVLRTRIFHGTHSLDDGRRDSRAEFDVAQEDFRSGCRPAGDRETDSIEAPVK